LDTLLVTGYILD